MDSLASKSRRELFVRDLSSWVMENAPKLLLADSWIQHEGYKITLQCIGDCGKWNGNIGRMPQGHEDTKSLENQLERAVRHGLLKLAKYKAKPGFKTALLLEDIAGTLRGDRLSNHEGLEEVDYIVVFVSSGDQMIIGNVRKEGPIWYSFVPFNRRFPRTHEFS